MSRLPHSKSSSCIHFIWLYSVIESYTLVYWSYSYNSHSVPTCFRMQFFTCCFCFTHWSNDLFTLRFGSWSWRGGQGMYIFLASCTRQGDSMLFFWFFLHKCFCTSCGSLQMFTVQLLEGIYSSILYIIYIPYIVTCFLWFLFASSHLESLRPCWFVARPSCVRMLNGSGVILMIMSQLTVVALLPPLF